MGAANSNGSAMSSSVDSSAGRLAIYSAGGLALATSGRPALAVNGGGLALAVNSGGFLTAANGGFGEPRTAAMISREQLTRMSRRRRYRFPMNGGRFPAGGLGEPWTVVPSMPRVEEKKGEIKKTFKTGKKQIGGKRHRTLFCFWSVHLSGSTITFSMTENIIYFLWQCISLIYGIMY